MGQREYYAYVNRNASMIDNLEEMLSSRSVRSFSSSLMGNGLILYSFITDPETYRLIESSNSYPSITFSEVKLTNISHIGEESGLLTYSGTLQNWIDNVATADSVRMRLQSIINTTTGEENQLGIINYSDIAITSLNNYLTFGNGGSNLVDGTYDAGTFSLSSPATATFNYSVLTTDHLPINQAYSKTTSGTPSETNTPAKLFDHNMTTYYGAENNASGVDTVTITVTKPVKRGDIVWIKAYMFLNVLPNYATTMTLNLAGTSRSFTTTATAGNKIITANNFIMAAIIQADASNFTITLTMNNGTSSSTNRIWIYECELIPIDEQL